MNKTTKALVATAETFANAGIAPKEVAARMKKLHSMGPKIGDFTQPPLIKNIANKDGSLTRVEQHQLLPANTFYLPMTCHCKAKTELLFQKKDWEHFHFKKKSDLLFSFAVCSSCKSTVSFSISSVEFPNSMKTGAGLQINTLKKEESGSTSVEWEPASLYVKSPSIILTHPRPAEPHVPVEKPPLGLMPRWRHEELRIKDICDAMNRYADKAKLIPEEWKDELRDLQKRMEMYEQTRELKKDLAVNDPA